MIRDYPISKVATNEWLDFAMYTVESRAIPNMVDGMKPVQRFYVYSSIKNSKNDFKKVSAVAGVVSDYGYNHGESSAASAGQLMASEWSNNICLIEGRGSFGTRLVQAAAAPRYTYTKLHENFNRYIMDIDLAPDHNDPEHEPPAFYIPVIPLVLANGVKGIATGFATNILPRDPDDLIRACSEYIDTGEIDQRIEVKFPDFNGTVSHDPQKSKFVSEGTFFKKSKMVLVITEVPYGYDREGYVNILDGLEDAGHIGSYEDLCDKDGFRFEVKFNRVSAKWSNEKIKTMFKLTKSFTENITVIDHEGKLREYDDERDLVCDFCDYRMTVLHKRIELRKQEAAELARWLNVKMQFIQAVLDDKIKFKNQKKNQVAAQIYNTTDATTDEDIDRLLKINILSLTDEMVKQLTKEIKQAEGDLQYWIYTTATKQFKNDLKQLTDR